MNRRRGNRTLGLRQPRGATTVLVVTPNPYTWRVMKAKIYHNPRCSKSRATLALLRERGVDVEIIDYIETPPSKDTLRALLRKLGGPALGMVRTEEQEFRPHAQRALTDEEVIDLLAREPRLLQRPIVELGGAARIGRPPERVLELVE